MEHEGPAASVPREERRRFLARISAFGTLLSGVMAGTVPLVAFLSPVLRKPVTKAWTRVVDDVNNVEVGVPFKVDFVEAVDDAWVQSRALRSVWLYTEDAVEFRAMSGVCTHLGCSVGFDAEKQQFHCPCHHGLFDMKTGAVLGGPPPRGLDTLPVKVENGEVHIQYQTFRAGIDAKVEV
ncbi:MAG: hypothetical protein C0503_06405 [Gemmatimonas sp.]|nr:hypothetical protein [Gemmatimonas sp.]